MKSLILTTLLILVMVICVYPQQFDERPMITVNGEAVVTVQPDQIVINFGIETWDKDILIANSRIMKL